MALKAKANVNANAKPAETPEPKRLSDGQLAYEKQRAAKAGKSLDEWLKLKARTEAAQAKKTVAKPLKKPGLISRLIDKAHKPL